LNHCNITQSHRLGLLLNQLPIRIALAAAAKLGTVSIAG